MRRSLAFSLILHGFIALIGIHWLNQPHTASPTIRTTWIDLEPAKKQQQEQFPVHNQVVQSAPGTKARQAPKDAYLGEVTQEVDRQTVSRDHTTRLTAHQTPPAAVDRTRSQAHAEHPPDLKALGIALFPSLRAAAQKSAQPDTPQWEAPSDTPQDYVKGVRESDRTALNTKEYVFFGYFQRIRERLDNAWVPILHQKISQIYLKGRQLASDMEHSTRVMVTMDAQGSVVGVQVISESGTQDLDDAAVKAFNAAGPFPNPPRGIVDTDGKIHIPWEFILKT